VAGGVTPDKANILDTWTATDESGRDAFAYLAFAPSDGGGDTTLASQPTGRHAGIESAAAARVSATHRTPLRRRE
jgi:hypothetical protein